MERTTDEVRPAKFEGVTAESVRPSSLIPSKRLSLAVMSLAALLYCVWILSLPVFPTQDGPVHLYYARVMEALLFQHDPGVLPHFYTIKHMLPPYATYYYLLIAFGHFVPLVVADKLVICVYIVLFLFGLRYLAVGLGPSGNAVSMLAIPFALNWALGRGYVNFCLSLALGLWMLGLWCRVALQPSRPLNGIRLCGFLTMAIVAVLTHPVPLILVLSFCVLELAIRVLRSWQAKEELFPRSLRHCVLAALLASATMLYVGGFTTAHLTHQSDPEHPTYLGKMLDIIDDIEDFNTVDFLSFSPDSILSMVRRVSLFAIFFGSVMIAWTEMRRNNRVGSWRLVDTWLMLALALWLLVPVLPPEISGARAFSQRLTIFPVLAALAAASGSMIPPLPRRLVRIAGCEVVPYALAGMVLLGITLVRAQAVIAPIARESAQLENLPQLRPGVYLLLLDENFGSELDLGHYQKDPGAVTYNPFLWNAARAIRSSGSILYDPPWLDHAFIPIGTQPALKNDAFDLVSLENEKILRQRLMNSGKARESVLSQVDGVIIEHGMFPAPSAVDPLLAADATTGRGWSCHKEASLLVCVPTVARGTSQPGLRLP
jgi:hypothetical protein